MGPVESGSRILGEMQRRAACIPGRHLNQGCRWLRRRNAIGLQQFRGRSNTLNAKRQSAEPGNLVLDRGGNLAIAPFVVLWQ